MSRWSVAVRRRVPAALRQVCCGPEKRVPAAPTCFFFNLRRIFESGKVSGRESEGENAARNRKAERMRRIFDSGNAHGREFEGENAARNRKAERMRRIFGSGDAHGRESEGDNAARTRETEERRRMSGTGASLVLSVRSVLRTCFTVKQHVRLN